EACAHVRLVLMVAADELDLHAVGLGIEIRDRELRGSHRAGAADVGIEARHIAEDGDLDDAVGVLRKGGTARRSRVRHYHAAYSFHSFPPYGPAALWVCCLKARLA